MNHYIFNGFGDIGENHTDRNVKIPRSHNKYDVNSEIMNKLQPNGVNIFSANRKSQWAGFRQPYMKL